MSIIACTSPCIYQGDGTCHLEQSTGSLCNAQNVRFFENSTQNAVSQAGCLHFVGKSAETKRSQV